MTNNIQISVSITQDHVNQSELDRDNGPYGYGRSPLQFALLEQPELLKGRHVNFSSGEDPPLPGEYFPGSFFCRLPNEAFTSKPTTVVLTLIPIENFISDEIRIMSIQPLRWPVECSCDCGCKP